MGFSEMGVRGTRQMLQKSHSGGTTEEVIDAARRSFLAGGQRGGAIHLGKKDGRSMCLCRGRGELPAFDASNFGGEGGVCANREAGARGPVSK